MFFSYLASNWIYAVTLFGAIAVCILGSIVKSVIVKKWNNKKKVEPETSEKETEENSGR